MSESKALFWKTLALVNTDAFVHLAILTLGERSTMMSLNLLPWVSREEVAVLKIIFFQSGFPVD